jgi:hypothetical protein
VVLCGLAGGAAMPALVAFGHMPVHIANVVGAIVLLGGWLGVLAYVIAQRRRAWEWASGTHGQRIADQVTRMGSNGMDARPHHGNKP